MPLVAGIDSSTQSCKVVIRDAGSGAVVRVGRAPHPDGTEVAPSAWEDAWHAAEADAGGIDDVAALAVAGQQHGMVCLRDDGEVVRDALLWNDTRSAQAAIALTEELGGPAAWADAVGSVPVASLTVTKLRWLAEHEPDNSARTAVVCLPHDWLTWRLRDTGRLDDVRTDRGDASGTGYWSPSAGSYRPDLLRLAMGREPAVPDVLPPAQLAGETPSGRLLAAGTGDNAAAALGLGARPGDVIVSIGTSGVACAVSTIATSDPSGAVAGFADATGRFLPLVCTLNAARVLDAVATVLGVDHAELSRLALDAAPGAGGLTLVPYLDGERTPNRPDAMGALHGLQVPSATPQNVARAAVEGVLCGLADGLDALAGQGVTIDRVLLIGGGARSAAVQQIAPTVFGRPVRVPVAGEYVADGAARQAAWALLGGEEPPTWTSDDGVTVEGDAQPQVRARYAEVRDLTAARVHAGA